MGKEDIKLKAYLEDARRYADLWNGSVFNGEQILKPEELQVVSPVLAKAYGENVLEKTRDLVMMQSGTGQYFAVYAVENQENIDYSMPARIMLQEALEYNRQIRKIMRENRMKDEEYRTGQGSSVFQNAGERMYMVRKTDKLYPIVTLIIYWGEEEWDGPKSLWEMIAFGEDGTSFGKELRRLIPEYSLHFLDLTKFEHFEYFKTELRPLLELYQKRNYKEKFIEYLKDYRNCMNMDDESWYLLSNLTHSKDIRRLIREKQRREGNEGMCRALEEWKADCKAEGKIEGKIEGRIEGRIESKVEDIIELLEDYGEVSDELKNNILSQNDLTLLKCWHKLAAHAGSIEEFVSRINNNI